MNDIDFENMADKCKELAYAAGAVIMNIYLSADYEVEHKQDASPLTLADRKANALICEGLKSSFPEIPIISEENKIVSFNTRQHYEYCWIVDPLDGTKEFINRNGEFTVNIALVRDQIPQLGVVYSPVLKSMAWAIINKGAYLYDGKEKTQLSAPVFNKEDEGLRVLCSRSHIDDQTKAFLQELNHPEIVPSGSSWKFIKIALGQGHIYPRLAPTMEWDTCAGQIVLEESGGKVLNSQSGQPLIYNKAKLKNPNFMAYGSIA